VSQFFFVHQRYIEKNDVFWTLDTDFGWSSDETFVKYIIIRVFSNILGDLFPEKKSQKNAFMHTTVHYYYFLIALGPGYRSERLTEHVIRLNQSKFRIHGLIAH
jgi:hypothetical protein